MPPYVFWPGIARQRAGVLRIVPGERHVLSRTVRAQKTAELANPAVTKNMNGAKRIRTADPLHAMQVLYQLSYGPIGALDCPDPGDLVGL